MSIWVAPPSFLFLCCFLCFDRLLAEFGVSFPLALLFPVRWWFEVDVRGRLLLTDVDSCEKENLVLFLENWYLQWKRRKRNIFQSKLNVFSTVLIQLQRTQVFLDQCHLMTSKYEHMEYFASQQSILSHPIMVPSILRFWKQMK